MLDDVLFDDDVSDSETEGTGERTGSVPGPLPKALQKIWDESMTKFEEFVKAFSVKSRKSLAVVWKWVGQLFKLSRDRNLYNMWVQRYALLNPKEADGTNTSRCFADCANTSQRRRRSTIGATASRFTRPPTT